MKNLALLLAFFLIISCDSEKTVSFEVTSKSSKHNIAVAYTNDADSLWTNEAWLEDIKVEMRKLSFDYNTVLLFSNEQRTPNVVETGINYPTMYDKYMVCGYWKYKTGNTKFCYGGVDENGSFAHCN